MSSSSNDDAGDDGEDVVQQESSTPVLLPEKPTKVGDYVVASWVADNGNLVRQGETVAMARLCTDKSSSSSNQETTAAVAVKHKRPNRRKRPSPAAAAVTKPPAANNEALKSIKLPSSSPMSDGNNKKEEVKEKGETDVSKKKEDSKKKDAELVPICAAATGILRIGDNAKSDPKSRCIGTIDPCWHPAVVGGMCVMCGQPRKASESSSSSPLDPAKNTNTRVTVSGGLTFTVSKQESVQMGKQNTERLRQLKKLSLILDLDATLLHTTKDPRATHRIGGRTDVRILLLAEGDPRNANNKVQHYVKLRPNVKEFFQSVMEQYEIGIYTAGVKEYAEQIAIVLARHMVGAQRDQGELDHLRFKVAQAEYRWNQQQNNNNNDNKKSEETTESKTDVDEQKQSTKSETKSEEEEESSEAKKRSAPDSEDKDEDEEPAPKKRKVTFSAGVKPAPKPSDNKKGDDAPPPPITAEEVQSLKDELEEAERLEKEAWKMRQRIFGGRIVTRTDVGDLGQHVKSLRRIDPSGGTMAAVVDDREDVWANAKDNNNDPNSRSSSRPGEPPQNVLYVKPYKWQPFEGFADVNNAAGVDLAKKESSKNGKDEKDDVQLIWTADILNRLHKRYYEQSDDGNLKPVPELLREMRENVLKGKKVVLSGIVPWNNTESKSRGPRQLEIRFVESLGGTLLKTVQPGTSFVIATRDDTDKVLTARRTPGCLVVKLSWLDECYRSISYRNPIKHLMAFGGRERNAERPPPGIDVDTARSVAAAPAPANRDEGGVANDEDDDDEDYDDFAAELESEF
ncbi:II subunit A C-terminal domain phosphatase [Seminavis robusta]|uniref:protein-serine/threonine phosphatase n=1 Tax=Seminavis robusta TaxID=568900 RepID=A0A9N8HHB1_9STRA|nr:II subunit A C-terminal domain phosphatase [Seminavis robusta]|eukprot:Sro527_g160600.1 II subunit A C-terminal domain phosphatase (796) ;mRNA; f:14478-16950